MAAPTLKDLGILASGLLGPKRDAYAAGVGAAAGGVAGKLSDTVRGFLYKQGQKLGTQLGAGGAAIPGLVAAGAANTGPTVSARVEEKFLGLSITHMVIFGFIVLGGIVLWLLRSKR